MNEKIKVQITTIHKTEDGEFPISVIADGNYKKIDDTHFISYSYTDEESGALMKSLIKANSDRVEVNGSGDLAYRMIFDKKKIHISKADAGGLALSIKQVTNDLSVIEDEGGIIISIDYELYQGEALMSSCDMKINILRRIQ